MDDHQYLWNAMAASCRYISFILPKKQLIMSNISVVLPYYFVDLPKHCRIERNSSLVSFKCDVDLS
jgi:hypothetical protein